ncbi:MAG TPA: hypothetical protein VFI09_12105 [Solirubrobacterales bacterium]|nr:hypothetical protein [Solirubrobacterales bacterium]
MSAGSVLAFGIAAMAFADSDTGVSCVLSAHSEAVGCPPLLPFKVRIGGRISPRKLPRHERRPVALELLGKFATTDGTHLSALREMVIDLDRDMAFDARGLPVCHRGRPHIRLRHPLARIGKICHDSIVGRGHMDFELAFPEQAPIETASRVVIFNDTAWQGAPVRLGAVAEVDVPVPTLVVMSIGISRVRHGDSSLRAVAKMPVVAGGSGSLVDFRLRIKRLFRYKRQTKSLVTARCSDDVFKLSFPELLFRNEAHTPGAASSTLIKGGLAISCSSVD